MKRCCEDDLFGSTVEYSRSKSSYERKSSLQVKDTAAIISRRFSGRCAQKSQPIAASKVLVALLLVIDAFPYHMSYTSVRACGNNSDWFTRSLTSCVPARRLTLDRTQLKLPRAPALNVLRIDVTIQLEFSHPCTL